MVKDQDEIIAGLDIGATKIIVLIGRLFSDGRYELIGVGQAPSVGLKKGMVVNIEATVQSIKIALAEAQLMAKCEITKVYVGIAGSHIRSFNSHGVVVVKDKEVSQADIERVIETAKAVQIASEEQILHVLPQEFVVDGQEGVREPLNMTCRRLEVSVHVVTGAISAASNIVKCVRRCGLEVEYLTLQPLASSNAVLTDDEKDLGVCMVDMGGGTTDIAIFSQGAIRHSAVIPFAGDQITSDVAMALRTAIADAEWIKIQYGTAKMDADLEQECFEVPGLGDRASRQVSRADLAAFIEPRVEELFELVQQVIRESGYDPPLSSGLVVTGGSALLPMLESVGEAKLLRPVRIGVPSYHGP